MGLKESFQAGVTKWSHYSTLKSSTKGDNQSLNEFPLGT